MQGTTLAAGLCLVSAATEAKATKQTSVQMRVWDVYAPVATNAGG